MRNSREVTVIVMRSVDFYIKLFLNNRLQLKLVSKVSGFEQTFLKFNPMLGQRVKARMCAKIFFARLLGGNSIYGQISYGGFHWPWQGWLYDFCSYSKKSGAFFCVSDFLKISL